MADFYDLFDYVDRAQEWNINKQATQKNLDTLLNLLLNNTYKDIIKTVGESKDRFGDGILNPEGYMRDLMSSMIYEYVNYHNNYVEDVGKISDNKYDRNHVAYTVGRYLESNDFKNADPGEWTHLLYSKIKRSAINSMVKAKIEAENKDYTIDSGFLNDLSALLDSGDRRMRGSSLEYREMQREIKDLIKFGQNHKELSEVETRYVRTMLEALADKADKYVHARKNTEADEPVTSYKGKRINIMRNVAEHLKNAAGYYKELDKSKLELFSDDDTEKYKKLLSKKFEGMTFNTVLYDDIYRLYRPNLEDKNYSHELVAEEAAAINKKYYNKYFSVNQVVKLQNKIDGYYNSLSNIFNDIKLREARDFRHDFEILCRDKYKSNAVKKQLHAVDLYPEVAGIIDNNVTGFPKIDERLKKVSLIVSKKMVEGIKNERNNEDIQPSCDLKRMHEEEHDAMVPDDEDGEIAEPVVNQEREF